MNAALTIRALGHRYGSRWALRGVDLEVPVGARVALVGPNGAGKSTLLNIATGLLAPTTGEVRVLGRRLDVSRIAYVAQDKPLYRRWPVRDLLRYGAATNPGWNRTRAVGLLTEHGIGLDERPDRLSGGLRTIVAIALALGKDTDLLVFDEPLADLDPLARTQVMEILAAQDATVLLSSHILADLAGVCDHLVLLGVGRVRMAGPFTDLLAAHDAADLETLVLDTLRTTERRTR